jgi:hypothetical protein
MRLTIVPDTRWHCSFAKESRQRPGTSITLDAPTREGAQDHRGGADGLRLFAFADRVK